MITLRIADLLAAQSAMAQAEAVWDQHKRDQEQLIEAFTPLASRLPRSLLLGPEPLPEVAITATVPAAQGFNFSPPQKRVSGFRPRGR
jgi:hypothetical protein